MASYGRTDWEGGFPFSPSPFAERSPAGRHRLTGDGLSNTGINDAHIPEGRAVNLPAHRHDMPRHEPLYPPMAPSALPVASRPFAQRPVARQSGLRLLPLASFVWGSRAKPPRPRTRADHLLLWVIAGHLQLDFPRQQHVMGKDAVRYIPAGTAFAALPMTGTEGYALLLAPGLLHETDPPFPRHALSGSVGEAAEALLATLRELAAESAKPNSGKAIHCLLGVLALRLARLEPPRANAARPPLPGEAQRPLVERFIALAMANLRQGRTIADLADELGTGTAALDDACRNARGKRAIELMHELRLQRAVEMLRETSRDPAQIARELGYTSHAHFTRSFVAATGRLPETFRDQSGRDQPD